MTALVANAGTGDRIPHDKANWMLIHAGAAPFNDDLTIAEKEHRLREGARALVQLWGDVQAEKTRREKALPRVKTKVLSPA